MAVHGKSEHKKPAILSTENEVLERESGDDFMGTEYQLKWEGTDNLENPQSMSVMRKWIVLMILASVSLCS